MTRSIAADTAMGAVTLSVADLDLMIRYYTEAVPLELISHVGPRAVLGRGDRAVIVLKHSPTLRHAGAHEAGLFHTAIVFDSQAALAAAVYSVAKRAPGTFTGSADHLVSNAFYFTDPEGNGVELYWDRDRSQWSWTHGQVDMDTLRLDPNQYLAEHLTERAVDKPVMGDAGVGHVHLSVGDIPAAREFYVGALGFDVTASVYNDSALFVSAGGYHHHLAMNTWNSRGAGVRGRTLGLQSLDIVLPDSQALDDVQQRLRRSGVKTADDGRILTVADPWANTVRVSVVSSP